MFIYFQENMLQGGEVLVREKISITSQTFTLKLNMYDI